MAASAPAPAGTRPTGRMDPILPQARRDAMHAQGFWADRILLDYFDDAVAAHPDAPAIVARNGTTGEIERFTWAGFRAVVDRIALGLAAHGIEPGDVVAVQLPNWWQFVAVHIAALRIGAVTNPLMPIFRHRELRFMLSFGGAKAIVIPSVFRGFDYAAMLEELRPDLPDLRHVFTVGGTFETALTRDRQPDAALFAARRPKADDVVQLIYTSGTTGEPKGVMHTPNTQLANIHAFIKAARLRAGEETLLMASPMAHQTGFLYGLMMNSILGAKLVLQDIWDAEVALGLIHAEGVTFTMGSTPFVADLANAPDLGRFDLSRFRTFVSAGAPIPRVLVERATERLGVALLSGWGMTENGCVTMARPGDPPDKVFGTDGAAIDGTEVRVVDDAGRPMPPDAQGRLQARGAGSFVGYLKRPERFDTDADGWFETGDHARMDADGYIRITGRAKDIIIRGGENVPVVEVEELLYRHPAIQDAAVVAMPDPRLGERGCAFVALKPAATLTLPELVAYLDRHHMAKNYMPERLEIVDAMPRTPSGKIQKFKLRELAQTLSAE